MMLGDFRPTLETLLQGFPETLSRAAKLRTAGKDDPIILKAAVIGFSCFSPILEWGKANSEYAEDFLYGPADIGDLGGSEDCRDAFLTFCAVAIGAVMGKFNSGAISDEDAAKAEFEIVGFASLNRSQICASYGEWRGVAS